MPDTPATNVETAGVYGQTGAIPVGSMATSGEVKDTTEIGGAGSVTARPESPVLSATPDTEGVYGPNDPGDFSPVSTLLTGTQDTTMGYAASANMAAPVYREPSIGVPVTLYESDRAYGYAEPVPQENYPWVADGTVETASFGAPGGHILPQTDQITLDIGTPQSLSKIGVLSDASELVVRKGATLLVEDTDYTVTEVGAGHTRTYTIDGIDSDDVNDGDTITVQYLYGDALYFATHDPDEAPPAPVIGDPVAGDRRVTVVWTNPALGPADDIDGYLIQSNTDGTRYAPGGVTSFDFEQVVPGQAYIFRVAAFNEAGLGEFSDWSDPVSPLHYDEVPPVGLDPKNTINPIYNADGTVVPGTGLGV